ncbi:MAG TPA: hypothetical protein VFG79_02790 [Solirubrobacter sp.]|nr:hypothetical protein [Solirubrobacter sp.]
MKSCALAALAAACVVAAPANAAEAPPGAIKNVEFVNNLPEGKQATAINFLTYGHGRKALDVMLITGRFGLKTYDMSNPESPRLLGEVGNDKLLLQYDIEQGRQDSTFWQNEDMDVDQRRKLAFLSRDPRAYGGSTRSDSDIAGVYIIDVKDPANPELITFKQLPTGHTTSCVNDCEWLWTGGPASTTSQRDDLGWAGGRPIIVTDLRDPANPVSYPNQPVDLFRMDGVTAYSHDVDVDAAGIAWVSGLGGMRGYWTEGVHRDPLTGAVRRATPLEPIPYAGGGFPDDAVDEVNNPGGWMHNGLRPTGKDIKHGPKPGYGYKPGSLVMGTEEDFNRTTCDGEGQFTIASLEGSYDGEGWRSTPEQPFRLDTVGTWSPKDKEGTIQLNSCSAHYFDLRNRLVAYGWYGQGTRILDISDPRNPIQVAYFRPDEGNVWASYWYGDDYVIVADHERGIDILKLDRGAKKASKSRKEVVAPKMSRAQQRYLAQIDRELAPDPTLGWVCPLPVD